MRDQNNKAKNFKNKKKNMYDINDILRELLDRYSNTPELDMQFDRMMREDEEFVKEYTVWCEENGYSVRMVTVTSSTKSSNPKTPIGTITRSSVTISNPSPSLFH